MSRVVILFCSIVFVFAAQVDGELPDDCSFASQVDICAEAGSRGIRSGDLDADGDMDIVVANENDESVSVFLNNGDGVFADDVVYPAQFLSNTVDIGDLDGDGDLDIAVGNRIGSISVIFNNGDGTFGESTHYDTSGGGPGELIIVDVDRDLDLDVVTLNGPSDNVIAVFLNDGAGIFVEDGQYPTMASSALDFAAEDFNGDGFVDFATANNNPAFNSVSVLMNNGDGTFTKPTMIEFESRPSRIDSDDIDGDSDMDLAVQIDGDVLGVRILLNDGQGGFEQGAEFELDDFARDIELGDANDDGNLDIVVVTSNPNNYNLYFGNGDGTFCDEVLNGFISASGLNEVIFADVDGDSFNDLITSSGDGDISIFVNDCLRLGDLNNDGIVSPDDVAPLIGILLGAPFNPKADTNNDGVVNLLDILPFLDLLGGG